jgi:cell division protein FtsZ
MRDGGSAILGSGKASGDKRAFEAVEKALNSPLLNDNSIKSAKWVLLNINSSRGEHEHTLDEVEMIQAYVQDQAGDDCDLIFGTGFDDNLNDEISVTVIATGFDANRTEEAYNASSSEALASLNPKIVFNLVEEKPAEIVNNNFISNEIINETLVQEMVNEVKSYSYEPQLIELEAPAIPSVLAFGAMRNSLQNVMDEKANVIEENSEIKIMNLANDMIENQHSTLETPIAINNDVSEIIENKDKTIELEITNAFSNDISHNKVNAVLNDIADAFKSEEPVATNFDIELKVKDASEIIEDEIVTIKGITLNRRKGNRLLSDYELEQEANFEIQKRSFDERASKLRSLSFNFDSNENKNEDEEIPAYIRRQQFLDNHPDSSEEHFSDVNVLANKNSSNSNVSTVNSFLNGKNPD